MKVKILPSKISGTICAPASKSYTHRAIILASLAEGISVIKNPLISEDTLATIEACKKLGAKITSGKTHLTIKGVNGRFPKSHSTINIFCGFSGTTMRLMTAVASLTKNKIVIDGEKRLRERPMKDLLIALNKFGIEVESVNKDFSLPLMIKGGNLKGGVVNLSGNVSSQFISALLLISPFAKKDTTLIVQNLKSKPYVDITVDLMNTFGVNVKVVGVKYFIKSGQHYKSKNYTVEGDYSSASYFFAAAAITRSKINLNNLNPEFVQGDKFFLEILKIINSNSAGRINIDLGNYPDLVPTVAILAATRKGETVIGNIKHLRMKESDRIKSLEIGLHKMHIKTSSTLDSLTITGGTLTGAVIDTFNDHRIAMSFAIAGLVADGETVINNAEVVNKSYPGFWEDLIKLGANLEMIN